MTEPITTRAQVRRRPEEGRPPNEIPTHEVGVMLTDDQEHWVDHAVLRLNYAARQEAADAGRKFHKIKRSHVLQTFIEAMKEAGYDPAEAASLAAFKADLVRRLKV
jgi:hypothetical protein